MAPIAVLEQWPKRFCPPELHVCPVPILHFVSQGNGREEPDLRGLTGFVATDAAGHLRHREQMMLKPSGLKIPGRTPKHASPVGRSSAGLAAGAGTQKDSKSQQLSPEALIQLGSY